MWSQLGGAKYGIQMVFYTVSDKLQGSWKGTTNSIGNQKGGYF